MNDGHTTIPWPTVLCLSLLLGACSINSPMAQVAAVTVLAPPPPLPTAPPTTTAIKIAISPTPVRIQPAAIKASETSSSATSPSTTSKLCNRVEFIDDVTAPLGTVLTPAEAFTKTWRIKNAGSCYWSAGYSLVLISGPQMGNTTSIGLPTNIPPGSIGDISVNLTAPLKRGYYQSFWKLQDPQGNIFGWGEQLENPLLVQIEVAGLPPNWSSYRDYGFDFNHPASWKFQEEQHFIYLSEGNRTLVIGYKLVEENVVLFSDIGFPKKELHTRTTVPFLGKFIHRQVLQNEKGKVKAMFYNNDRGGPEIIVGGQDPLTGMIHPILVFCFQVQDPTDYSATDIPENFQDVLDSILASFQWFEE